MVGGLRALNKLVFFKAVLLSMLRLAAGCMPYDYFSSGLSRGLDSLRFMYRLSYKIKIADYVGIIVVC